MDHGNERPGRECIADTPNVGMIVLEFVVEPLNRIEHLLKDDCIERFDSGLAAPEVVDVNVVAFDLLDEMLRVEHDAVLLEARIDVKQIHRLERVRPNEEVRAHDLDLDAVFSEYFSNTKR